MSDSGIENDRNRRCASEHALRRGLLLRLTDESGFTLIEMIIASVVLAIISAPLAIMLTAAGNTQRHALQQTGADQLAASEIEKIRALPYFSIGLSGGNPPGSLPPQTSGLSVSGAPVTVTRQVSYVDDMVKNQTETFSEYKRVAVTVSRVSDGKQLAQKVTFVSATSSTGGAQKIVIKVKTLDYVLNSPLAGVKVDVMTGPSAPRTDTTNPVGQVVFPALTSNPSGPAYQVYGTLAGYTTLPEDIPTAGNTYSLTPGVVQGSTLRMYKPATIVVFLRTGGGAAWTGSASISVGSSRGVSTYSYTPGSGSVTISNVVPGLSYTVGAQSTGNNYAAAVTSVVPASGYPNILSQSFALSFATAASTKTLNVTVKKGSSTVSGAQVEVSGGPNNVYLTGTTSGSGVASFTIPSGTPPTYAVKATNPSTGETGTTNNLTVTGTTTQGLTQTIS